ncbi:MAG: hypothetical protein ACE5KT_01605 [Methanosarcinales archaeon]|nr:hypothetical protein [Methanosarcinales archaeon]
MVDAREASLKVRDYFEELHEPFGSILFRIENVQIDKEGNWIVECSFYLLSKDKVHYRVIVDAKTGELRKVSEISKEKNRLETTIV